MTTPQIQSGADYADALIAARSAKLWLFLALAGAIVIQLGLFFVLRYPQWVHRTPQAVPGFAPKTLQIMQYGVGLLDFVGLVGSILFSLVLLLLVQIQLAARVVGVGKVTSAFVLSLLVLLLLFPWQAVLNNPAIGSDPVQSDIGMKIPGVLYTWAEVSNPKLGAGFVTDPGNWARAVLHWARYVVFPVVTLILLAVTQLRSSRGVGQSLGGAASAVTTPVV